MCGRYLLSGKNPYLESLISEAQNKTSEILKTGEIFPSDTVPVLVNIKGNITVYPMKWGFPGLNAKLLINTRLETAATLKTWKYSYAHRRCIIPSSGFYEWDKLKNKYLFTIPSSPLLFMAGIYTVIEIDDKKEYRFSVMTAKAGSQMSEIHERTPVVISGDTGSENNREWIFNSNFGRNSYTENEPDSYNSDGVIFNIEEISLKNNKRQDS